MKKLALLLAVFFVLIQACSSGPKAATSGLPLEVPASSLYPIQTDSPTANDYAYQNINGGVMITGYHGAGGKVVVPSFIGGKQVVSIAEEAFRDQAKITEITIPDGVVDIGESAFAACEALQTVALPDSVINMGQAAFGDCTALKKITLPQNLEAVSEDMFMNCPCLQSMVIPNHVIRIGFGAFQLCRGLESIHISESVESIEDSVFANCSSLANIEVDAANANYASQDGILYNKGKTVLVCCPENKKGQVTVPDGVTEIGASALEDCSSLTDVTLPGSVLTIDNNAFNGCTGLVTMNIPEGVQYMDTNAFYGCTGLKSVSLPESLEDIMCNVFDGSTSLENIHVEHSNPCLHSIDGVLYDTDGALRCYPEGKKGAFTIPDGVWSIWANAFSGCSGLTEITIPKGVTEISEHAFEGCTGLQSVDIPDGVTTIGDWAFTGCTGLITVSIPASVQTIGERAFDCSTEQFVDEGTQTKTIPVSGKLQAINVAAGNQNYSSKDGVLYNKDKSVLIRYPAGKQGPFTIPGSVQEILPWAFSYSEGLTTLDYPHHSVKVGENAFYDTKH